MKRLALRGVLPAFVLSLVLAPSASASPIPFGGHYYDVIAAPGITWANARAGALSGFYLGLQGHLVTITSVAEDNAVFARIEPMAGPP